MAGVRNRKKWDESYADLVAYHKKYGHCNVPNTEKELSIWVNQQRHGKAVRENPRRAGHYTPLSDDDIDRLNAIGFDWGTDRYEKQWNDMFEKLKRYKEQHGDCLVPGSFAEDPPSLGIWVATQRRYYKRGIIRQDRKEKLEKLGFVWCFSDRHKRSQDGYRGEESERQKAFSADLEKVEIGSRVSVYWPDDDQYYDATVTRLRNKKPAHYLEYDDGDCEWIDFCQHKFLLLPAKRKLGQGHDKTVHVGTESHVKDDLTTSDDGHAGEEQYSNKRRRVSETKSAESDEEVEFSVGKKSGCKSADGHDVQREAPLESSDKTMSARKMRTWDESYDDLVAYQKKYGHCNVPQRDKKYKKLGRWVSWQRNRKAASENPRGRDNCTPLSVDQIDRLNAIGFVWVVDRYAKQWNNMFEKLKRYKELNGDCLVPQCFAKDLPLGQWVNTQRKDYKRGTIRQDRKVKLEKLGFAWRTLSVRADYRRKQLQDGYREEQLEPQNAHLLADMEKVKIGSRVSVYWPDDDRYYDATVTRQRNKKEAHYLEYDDGESEWIDFSQHKFLLLPAKRKRRDVHDETVDFGTKYPNKRRRVRETRSAESDGEVELSAGSESDCESTDGHDEASAAPLESDRSSDTSVDSDTESGQKWYDNDSVSPGTKLDEHVHSERTAAEYDTSSADLANVKIGSRVSVYWPDDDRYYTATVTRFIRIKNKPFYLEYDGGDREWIDLSQNQFRLLSAIETDAGSSVRDILSASEALRYIGYDHNTRRVVSPTENLSTGRTTGYHSNEENEFSNCESQLECANDERVEPMGDGSGHLDKNTDCIKDGYEVMEPIYDMVAGNTSKNEEPQRHSTETSDGESLLQYPIGTRVRKLFDSLGWFDGKVTSYDGGYYMVTYEDGDTEEYDDNEMTEIVLTTPDVAKFASRVAVVWPDQGRFSSTWST